METQVVSATGPDIKRLVRDLELDFKPNFLFLFADARFDQKALLKNLKKKFKSQMIGCTGMTQIDDTSVWENKAVIAGIKTDKFKVFTFAGPIRTSKEIASGEALGKKIISDVVFGKEFSATYVRLKNKVIRVMAHALITFIDPLAGDGDAFVKGLLNVLGPAFPILGAAAGDNKEFKRTYQYCNWNLYSKSATVALVESETPISFGVAHGWKPISPPHLVTKSKGNIIYRINNKPAIKIYEDFFGKSAEELQKVALGRLALENPLGIPTFAGQYCLRHPIIARRDGAIVMSGTVPEQTVVRIMGASLKDNLEAAKKAAKEALLGLGRSKPALCLIFDCGARAILRGLQGYKKEYNVIKSVIGKKVPTAGFHTYGEIAPIFNGPSRLLNETCVILLIGGG